MNSSVKKIGCAILSGILGISMMPVQIHAQDLNPTKKEETVFTVLNQDGSVDSSIVSSWIHDDDGIKNIQEQLNLKNVENVKTDEEPQIQNDTYTWNAKGNDVYYQGESSEQLPVEISIQYTLDGQAIRAKDLEGKSGHLQVQIHTSPRYSRVVNGITIHPSFVLGGAMILDDDTIQNVNSDQGKIIDDGNRKVFVFATVPGLHQTLQQAGIATDFSDDIEWQADVSHFKNSEMMMAMSNEISPFDLPQLDVSSIDTLYAASEQLLDGSRQLNEGTDLLKKETAPLADVPGQLDTLAQGILQLSSGSHTLKDSVEQYTSGVHSLYAGSQKLEGISQSAGLIYDKEQNLVQGVEQLEYGLGLLEQNADKMNEEQFQQAITQLENQMKTLEKMMNKDEKILEGMQTQLETIQKQMPQLQQCIAALDHEIQEMNRIAEANNEKIQTNNEEWNHKKAAAIQSIDSSIQALESLEPSEEIQQAVQTLTEQKTQLESMQDLPEFETFDMTMFHHLVQTLTTSMETFAKTISQSEQAMQSMSEDLASAKTILKSFSQMQQSMHIQQTIQTLQASVHQLHQGAVQVKNGTLVLDQSLKLLKDKSKEGIDAVNAGAMQLDSKGSQLNNGAMQLDMGMAQLSGSLEQFESLKSGLIQLNGAIEQMNDGSGKLYEGHQQFQKEGMDVLKSQFDLTSEQIQTLESVLQAIDQFNQDVRVFSGTPQGSIHTTRYVFRVN